MTRGERRLDGSASAVLGFRTAETRASASEADAGRSSIFGAHIQSMICLSGSRRLDVSSGFCLFLTISPGEEPTSGTSPSCAASSVAPRA